MVYSTDTAAELELVCSQASQAGAVQAVPCSPWAEGGAGSVALAEAVLRAAETPRQFSFLYELEVLYTSLGSMLWRPYLLLAPFLLVNDPKVDGSF